MFFFISSPRHPDLPPCAWLSSLSFSSELILSKKELDLLYDALAPVADERLSFLAVPLLVVFSTVPFASGSDKPSAMGEPDAMASLMRSSLLNFAFAVSKS